ncbi:hypothetical protein [Wenxinia marina]|uniref:Sulfotransferase family n=1 Tax=Wenxinia marina DSM 24838 TaxID=1123501 RepID=A0A0D0NRX4_9RHOB|nr:hypothetical protein [Wenxinia marina]KIQ70990.1 hypothetical protein Wenmar_00368 [Wenxinia marina DSM 24838]GGL55716.1 hypothetical protein GCM10011392_07660 [Wenxinia marina]
MAFAYFVVLAGMRTGSNFLEANLNALDGVECHGEAFNQAFIGYPNRTEILGISREARDSDPTRLLSAVRDQPGTLAGFRYFHDHDPRVLRPILDDPACAKIVLTRNPIESYISRKIASATGQWKLTNVKHARAEQAEFDGAEFEAHLTEVQGFQVEILSRLQRTGQTAFYVDYEDLQDLEVMNGLATWLGVPARLDALDRKLKKQNPEPMEGKVANFAGMAEALARLDRFNLSRTPNFEPRRGPAIPTYLAAARTSLLFRPLRSGPEAAVAAWLTELDGQAPVGNFTYRTLRQWMAERPGYRSFAVLRHPLARAHAAFCERILARGPGSFPEIRRNLGRTFGLELPDDPADAGYGPAEHRAAFATFLTFLKANLGGQTNIRTDPAWSSQAALLEGMAGFVPPDALLREDELPEALPALARQVGREDAPAFAPPVDPNLRLLAAIRDDEIEALGRAAMARDYLSFGFGPWRG